MLFSLNLALPSIFKLNCNDLITGVKLSNLILTLSFSIFSTPNSTATLLLTFLLSATPLIEYANITAVTVDIAIKLTNLLFFFFLLFLLVALFSNLF